MTQPTNSGLGWLQNGLFGIGTWINDGQGGVQQAAFTVHPDQLPVLRDGMQKAQDKLKGILAKALDLQNIQAPGADEVSKRAVQRLGEKAGSGDGCLTKAVSDGIQRLQNIVDQVDAAARTYQQTDDNAKM